MSGRVIRKRTPVELIAACYESEGERPKEGESRTAWVNERYVVTVDARNGFYVAKRRARAAIEKAKGQS